MAFAGVTQEAIADFLGISKDQLGRHFRQELNRAQGGRVAKVAQANYERAIGYDPETRTVNSKDSNVLAQMFILKNQPGKFREKWNETVTHEHTGEIVHRPDDKELGRRIALALSMADTKVIDHAPAEIIEVEDGETD
ncbi:MAG: hypothetical protein ACYS8I_06740 [Planctomycetota bacterium]|jgi:hypothetical protein